MGMYWGSNGHYHWRLVELGWFLLTDAETMKEENNGRRSGSQRELKARSLPLTSFLWM